MATRRSFQFGCALFFISLCFSPIAIGQTETATISGLVTDETGAVVQGAEVRLQSVNRGTVTKVATNDSGIYVFAKVQPDQYQIAVHKQGFKQVDLLGIIVNVQDHIEQNFRLQVGSSAESVTVSSSGLHVETVNTQMGEVIEGKEMTEVPLVSRSYTDLLALQPGVVSSPSQLTGAYGGTFESATFALPEVSGSLNSGALSVNGMREGSNGFVLNGASVRELGFGGTAVVPNLDSIAEFRIVTNNFDAEYGNYAGGQINVVTKSGENRVHGSVFEFLRNTDLDAANYFDPGGQRGAYRQNQFGGTIGGPIRRDKVFFFADYQGNKLVQGVTQSVQGLPTTAELGGNFSGLASQMTNTVNGPAWANSLSNRLGYQVQNAEPYYSQGCTSTNISVSTHCVFPGAIIPAAAFDPVSRNILALNIFPITTTGGFSTSAYPIRLTDNKTSGRVDTNTRVGMISAYYFLDTYNRNDPYWPVPLTYSLPGFSVDGTGRTQMANVGDTKTFGSGSAVNEFHVEYLRYAPLVGKPSGGVGQSLQSLGFASPANGGIFPLSPIQGVPELDFKNFTTGISTHVVRLFENTVQTLDNFSKVIGTHTLQFGAEYHYNQLTEELSNVEDGAFGFGGLETGIDFADFLLGAPTVNGVTGFAFLQGFAPSQYNRNHYFGAYAQDSWHARSTLTLNYGLRWDVSAPWSERQNKIQTLVPGEQSRIFPNAPVGWVFPGDPGIPNTLAPTRYNNFAPRIGLAYSPNAKDGLLRKLLGEPGQSSIRAGYGIFYSAFDGTTALNELSDAPFGNFRASFTGTPTFSAPWVDRAAGMVFPNPFPTPPLTSNVNFAAKGFLPIASSPGFYYRNRLPYAEEYELSLQRQFSGKTLLTVSYVGTEGHRLMTTLEANPGSPALCATLNALGATPSCGPGGEGNVYVLPAGISAPRGAFTSTVGCPAGQVCVDGTRTVFDATQIGSDGLFKTIGNSGYNSAQVNVRHTGIRWEFLAGYTFSKSLDDSSGYGEQVNPNNARLSRALSAFDVRQNFVISYSYRLPLDKLAGPKRLVQGWSFSGITRFSTGLPVTLVELDDDSELGTSFSGPQPLPVDTPNFAGGSVGITDPRKSATHTYFNTTLFSPSAIGHEGDAARRFFHGPGINNWDMALLKDTTLTESVKFEFRAEFFNIFNHAQFQTPSGILESNFGLVLGANPPRIGQMALKLFF